MVGRWTYFWGNFGLFSGANSLAYVYMLLQPQIITILSPIISKSQGHYPRTLGVTQEMVIMGLTIIYHHLSIKRWWFSLLILRGYSQGFLLNYFENPGFEKKTWRKGVLRGPISDTFPFPQTWPGKTKLKPPTKQWCMNYIHGCMHICMWCENIVVHK